MENRINSYFDADAAEEMIKGILFDCGGVLVYPKNGYWQRPVDIDGITGGRKLRYDPAAAAAAPEGAGDSDTRSSSIRADSSVCSSPGEHFDAKPVLSPSTVL